MTESMELLETYRTLLNQVDPIKVRGRVQRVIGTVLESVGPIACVGDLCTVHAGNNGHYGYAEVVGFKDNKVLLMPLHQLKGIAPGSEVSLSNATFSIPVGEPLLGRVIDGLGRPIDSKGPILTATRRTIYRHPPRPLERQRIRDPLPTGIRALDALLTLGRGQRIGIFAGSGVGKSTLLGMMARYTEAEVNVIALIGERGREVREFLEKDLGEEGLRRSVVVAVTSDEMPLVRVKGALVATTIAEYFRDQGHHVLLMMDSLTRVAMAQREIGLAIGEPPTTKGYTPSTFALMPQLVERAGNAASGSITGIYTVLVEADDLNDPIADTARSTLDGHVVLSRKLASAGHYPAVDPLQSVSRSMTDVVSKPHLESARKVLEILATYQEAEDLINIGAYAKGSNPKIDYALAHIGAVRAFLQQGVEEQSTFEESVRQLVALTSGSFGDRGTA